MTKPSKQERIRHEEDYVAFLTKRLASPNFLKNVSAEEVEKTKAKLAKAKLVLKVLKS